MEAALMVVLMGGGIPALIIIATGINKALTNPRRGLSEEDATALRREVAETGERLAAAEQQLADSSARLVELEERVDFAERLLARPPERGQIQPGA